MTLGSRRSSSGSGARSSPVGPPEQEGRSECDRATRHPRADDYFPRQDALGGGRLPDPHSRLIAGAPRARVSQSQASLETPDPGPIRGTGQETCEAQPAQSLAAPASRARVFGTDHALPFPRRQHEGKR